MGLQDCLAAPTPLNQCDLPLGCTKHQELWASASSVGLCQGASRQWPHGQSEFSHPPRGLGTKDMWGP